MGKHIRKTCRKCGKVYCKGDTVRIILGQEYCNRCDNPPIKLSDIVFKKQEFPSQKKAKEILNNINKAIKVWDNYQKAKVFNCPFNKDKCEEIKKTHKKILKKLQLDTFIKLNKEDMIKFKKWLQLEKEGK